MSLTPPSAASGGGYKEVSKAKALQLPADKYRPAAHGMVYARQPGKFLGKYDYHYAVMLQMRFDGMLGFPGGIVDGIGEEQESLEKTVSREFEEEVGSANNFTESDHVVSHFSDQTRLCLHFYAKEVTMERFLEIERRATAAVDWGSEVLGVVRCPLYTLPNGLGLPAFLRNEFIGNSRDQLLITLERRGLLPAEAVRLAVSQCEQVNGYVTAEEINY